MKPPRRWGFPYTCHAGGGIPKIIPQRGWVAGGWVGADPRRSGNPSPGKSMLCVPSLGSFSRTFCSARRRTTGQLHGPSRTATAAKHPRPTSNAPHRPPGLAGFCVPPPPAIARRPRRAAGSRRPKVRFAAGRDVRLAELLRLATAPFVPLMGLARAGAQRPPPPGWWPESLCVFPWGGCSLALWCAVFCRSCFGVDFL